MTSIFETLEALQVLDSDAKLNVVCKLKQTYQPLKPDLILNPMTDSKIIFNLPIVDFTIISPSSFENVAARVDLNTELGLKVYADMQQRDKTNCFKLECVPKELKELILKATEEI